MPGRNLSLNTDETYHIYNRGIDQRLTFEDDHDCHRASLTLKFYQPVSPPMKLSQFLSLEKDKKEQVLNDIYQQAKLVEFLSFCFMPNHFHLLLKQNVAGGISKFMSNFQNSYTRFFNTKNERTGSLFLKPFKAVRIFTEQQLLHVSRYIHLNPYSASVVENIEGLLNYPWSSLPEYLNPSKNTLCETNTILSHFKDKNGYRDFVLDQADYQKELEEIKHLLFEFNTSQV